MVEPASPNPGLPRYPLVDLSKIATYSLDDRPSKVSSGMLGSLPEPGGSFTAFAASLPDILAARNLRLLVDRLVRSR